MAYFAKLGTGNKVISVVVVSDDVAITEQAGVDFLNDLYKTRDVWKQTYMDGSQRKNYAGLGYKYDAQIDAFIPPNPYASWTLNESTCHWYPPVAHPDDGKKYTWNEETISWDEVAE